MAKIVSRYCPGCKENYNTTNFYDDKLCPVCKKRERDKEIEIRLCELRSKTLEERVAFLEEEFCRTEVNRSIVKPSIIPRAI